MKQTKSLVFAITLITLLTSSITYATLSPLTPPPVGGYDSGSNSILDPGCAPNAVDCVVNLPSGGSVTPTNGLSLIGSDIGLGGTLTQNTSINQDGFKFSTIFTDDGTAFSVPVDYSIENGSSRAIATTGQKMRIGMFSELPLYNLYAGIGFREADQGPSPIMYEETNGLYKAFFFGDQESWVSTYNPTDQTSGSLSARSNEIRLGYDDSLLNISRGILVDTNGVTFSWGNIGNDNYLFPNSRGTSNQVLTTDGAGQLSWQNAGGGSGLQWYSENAAAPTTAPVATGAGSIALGDGAQALSDFMFVYGFNAGVGATNAIGSNFFGENAGQDAVSASSSNFFGESAGTNATNASYSNFFGDRAGTNATNANNSNFLGNYAGNGATNAFESNFFGTSAGQDATSASDSIFIGRDTGRLATNANKSVFLMYGAGSGATNANNSIFIGEQAGEFATNANNSIFQGTNAGSGATDATEANFIGLSAGQNATNANNSNFIGYVAGFQATSAFRSNFLGRQAGGLATNANNSNFFGTNAGIFATNAEYSNFIGFQAGASAANAKYSNFFGYGAGLNATNAERSNFIGIGTGTGATNASNSNFLGFGAGQAASDASNSNFLGQESGYLASNANNSNFFGYQAGRFAIKANNSIFIGTNAGDADTVDNSLGGTSILIGDNTSTGGFSDSISLGKGATNTSSNQFMIGSTTRPIDETKIIGSLGTECTITTGTGMACTSDERLKTNITDLNSDTLSKLQNVRTVSYNWLQNPNSPTQIGFLAQNLEQYFPEMVMTDATGKKQVYYSQMTPILTKAIQELNLKVDLLSMNTGNTSTSVFEGLIAWLENAGNGIRSIVVKDKICVDDQCLTKDDIRGLLEMKNQGNPTTVVIPPVVVPTPDPVTDPVADQTPTDQPTDDPVPTTEPEQLPTDQPTTIE